MGTKRMPTSQNMMPMATAETSAQRRPAISLAASWAETGVDLSREEASSRATRIAPARTRTMPKARAAVQAFTGQKREQHSDDGIAKRKAERRRPFCRFRKSDRGRAWQRC